MKRPLLLLLALCVPLSAQDAPLPEDTPLRISGIYPHLRMWNTHAESGTGAVVPWQGSLWAITYAPHMPNGSTDKLYEITPDLEQKIFEGSVGGTPANRMIHRESDQLLIGPYLIDAGKRIRVIPPSKMFGRLTGTARHLADPANKVYYATMEEGLYEVDVRTLEVKCLIRDGNHGAPDRGIRSTLPGYHGKGLYSSQGYLVYANNGDRDPRVRVDPTVASGALAQWSGEGDWQLVRRNQFTEVTGPGGITGNPNPTDPVWAMGWDERSLLLALFERGEWHYFRLPKGSHSYDGAHGWNTEWPRIREIGEEDYLGTMHGTFWHFPPTFSLGNTAGIAPRSNYLKVIGDFCRWGDRIVIGCDDSAAGEFLNTRPFKAKHGAPLQSNSNLWFLPPEKLDDLGPVIGRGSVWLRDEVAGGVPGDPYLFAGYDHRMLHLTHGNETAVTFRIDVDREGTGTWELLSSLTVESGSAISHAFPSGEAGEWIRITAEQSATGVTAQFQYRNRDPRPEANGGIIAGVATGENPAATTGVMRSLAHDRLGLVASSDDDPEDFAYYEIDSRLDFVRVDDPEAALKLVRDVRQPEHSFTEDEASLLLIEDGERYRLPRSPRYTSGTGTGRSSRSADDGGRRTLEDFMEDSLTLGASVKVTSTLGDYTAPHAVDGVIRSDAKRWVSTAGDTAEIEIDLGAPRKIRSLWIVSGWEGRTSHVASDFTLEYDSDGSWKAFPGGVVRGNTKTDFALDLAEAITTTRIRMRSGKAGHLRLYELAAFDRILEIANEPFAGYGPARVCREVATERDLLNLHGTFYELPARNAGGLAKVRPIATHDLAIQDFCSHNGLLFFTGIDATTESDHLFRSDDGKAAVWAGAIDDLWKLGKPRGEGGPWKNAAVQAGKPSDRYLMTGYDRKSCEITVTGAATIRLEVDVDGTGLWIPWKSFPVEPGETIRSTFPEAFSAYWIRAVSDTDTKATVWFRYE